MSSEIANAIAKQDIPTLRQLLIEEPSLLLQNAGTYRHYMGFLNEYQPPPAEGRFPTPLHYAASLGSIKVVQWLLDHGAKPDAVNGDGETAADVACSEYARKAVLGLLGPYFREAPRCRTCREEFGITFRRHHCRACGSSFCNEHSKYFVPLPKWYGSEPQRACFVCFEKWVASQPASDQDKCRRRATHARRGRRAKGTADSSGGSGGAGAGSGSIAGAGAGAGSQGTGAQGRDNGDHRGDAAAAGAGGAGKPPHGTQHPLATTKTRSVSTGGHVGTTPSRAIVKRRLHHDRSEDMSTAIAARSWGAGAYDWSSARTTSTESYTDDDEGSAPTAAAAAGYPQSRGIAMTQARAKAASMDGPSVGVELSLLSPPKYE